MQLENTFFTMLLAMPADRVGRLSAGLAAHGKLVFLLGQPSEDGFQAALICQDDDPLSIASTAELAANGVRPDESRRNKEFVEVGQWAT
jgi:hypothetical protein